MLEYLSLSALAPDSHSLLTQNPGSSHDGSSNWVYTMHVGDLILFPASSFCPSPALAILGLWGVNQQWGSTHTLSLSLKLKMKICVVYSTLEKKKWPSQIKTCWHLSRWVAFWNVSRVRRAQQTGHSHVGESERKKDATHHVVCGGLWHMGFIGTESEASLILERPVLQGGSAYFGYNEVVVCLFMFL